MLFEQLQIKHTDVCICLNSNLQVMKIDFTQVVQRAVQIHPSPTHTSNIFIYCSLFYVPVRSADLIKKPLHAHLL